MPFIRSISGLRATLPDSLTEEIIKNYTSAFSTVSPDGVIIVGRDGRPSGIEIESVISSVLKSMGREVWVLGMVPTPTVQFMVEKHKAAGGIAITASHNPSQWNGMKFINSSGVFLNADENKALWEITDSNVQAGTNEPAGKIISYKSATDEHIESILRLEYLNDSIRENLSQKKLRVLVDAVNSSGSVAVISLLAKLGLEGIPLYCDGSGLFPHTPEPLPENLTELAAKVKILKADLGIAVDPDADRLVLIDENGNPIGEEKTIALAVLSVLSSGAGSGEQKNAVINYSTTRLVEDIAESFGGSVFRSAVGEINVVGKMKETGAVIGGEGSGGVILPASHYGRDSLVGIALVLSLLARENKSLSEICSALPTYEMVKLKRDFSGSLASILEKVKIKYAGYDITSEDGIRISIGKSWVQLRSSNTEPIVRVIAEAESKERAIELANEMLETAGII